MDITITINSLNDDTPQEKARLRAALAILLDDSDYEPEDETEQAGEDYAEVIESELEEDQEAKAALIAAETAAPPAGAARVPGQPAPGRKRRTKEEIAEDAAYFAANGGATINTTVVVAQAEPAIQEPTQISAQDAADEAAEAAQRPAGEATLEDLRKAVGRYTAAKGIAAAQTDIPKLLGCAMIEVPKDKIGEAVAKIDALLTGEAAPAPQTDGGSLFGEPPKPAAPQPLFESKPEEPPQATKQDVIEAFKAYAKKYDGRDDALGPDTTPLVLQDGPKILQAALGPDIQNIAMIPANPIEYGKALTAINKAVVENPFGRTPK